MERACEVLMLQTGGVKSWQGVSAPQRCFLRRPDTHTGLPVPENTPCSGLAAAPVLQGRTAGPEEKRVLVRSFKERAIPQFRALWQYQCCGSRVVPDLGSYERYKTGKAGLWVFFPVSCAGLCCLKVLMWNTAPSHWTCSMVRTALPWAGRNPVGVT